MKNSVLYGVLFAGIITGVVVATSDWVFAAPADEIDYTFVFVDIVTLIITCPDESQEQTGIGFEYSEKTTLPATSAAFLNLGPLVFADGRGIVTSGFVDKDNYAVRGIMESFTACSNPVGSPVVVTLVGNCGQTESGTNLSTVTTGTGITGTFSRALCS